MKRYREINTKPGPMRCISVAKDATRYFDEVAIQEIEGRMALKAGYLLGLLKYCIDHENSDGALLVVPVGEIAQLLRDAMETDGRTAGGRTST